MGTRMASNGPHAAGIFADMTVDGPEIGTLVLVVDRGKNLPNRKTMGKQNPYCAARLGKEARKTEVDKRGGQTPRWDQELRFTVHDSPDYYKLKISVFNEDKKTDLIGEAWVELEHIITPGGGKGDLWQGLTCKGKYAGELRLELTYYDSREKAEPKQETISMADELRQQYGTLNPKVKRRPLPSNPNAPATTDVVIPDRPLPGRAKHGPRDFQVAGRMASAPSTTKTFNYPQSESTLFGQKGVQALSQNTPPAPQSQPEPPTNQHYEEYERNPEPEVYDPYAAGPAQPDFLPQLGPSGRQRGSMPPQARYEQQQWPQHQAQALPRPLSHAGIPHSHSAPAVPGAHQMDPQAYGDSYQLRTDYPEPIPDVDYQYQQVAVARQRRHDVPPGWQEEFDGANADRQAYVEEDVESSPPPPPPMHSHSAPVVPQYESHHNSSPMPRYGATPPSSRQPYVPNASPLQSIERDYGPQQTPPSHGRPRRGESFDEYGGYSPYQSSHHSTPNLSSPVGQQSPSPYARTSPYGRQAPGRNSIAEPYGTPSRQPHPLSQEVSRARSPNPYGTPEHQISYNHYDQGQDGSVPMIKPRAISPAPPPSKPASASRSPYSLQFPVRAFESSDASPLSTSAAKVKAGTLPRKSVSPRPSISGGASSPAPFSPDDFGAHNPAAPMTDPASRNGPIVGWHGQEIDPSDHLPVDSWAPEPVKKTPTKTYGLGREKEFGPRSLSKDTVINVRMKPGTNIPEQQARPATSSNKIRGVLKKAQPQAPRYASEPPMELPRHHDNYSSVPDPYEQQQQQFSRSYREGSPAAYGPPSIPPKVPLSHSPGGAYTEDALSREISSIDIGGSRTRTSGTAFVPVRSHRDRNSYY